MYQIKEQDKPPEKQLNEVEISNDDHNEQQKDKHENVKQDIKII